jgi:hypothetical protein
MPAQIANVQVGDELELKVVSWVIFFGFPSGLFSTQTGQKPFT